MADSAPPPRRLARRSAAGLAALALLTGSSVFSCAGDPIGGGSGGGTSNRPDSQSMGRWSPSTDTSRFPNECSREVHDSYYVVGPDGRKYPTWHPPSVIDPATGRLCYFGHEHGENPAGSALWNELRRHFAWDANGNGTIDDAEATSERSGIPFGYAAEYGGSPATILHDSYKIAFVNDLARDRVVNGQVQAAGLRCNQLLAYAQDTQTARAFTQALHPLTYAIDCTGSGDTANYPSRLIVSVMADYGSTAAIPARTGEVAAGRRFAVAATQVYPNAFVAAGATSDLTEALRERWDTIVSLRTVSGAELARFNPGLEDRSPSRFQTLANGDAATQSIDLCYSGLDASGFLISDPAQAGSVVRQVRGSTTDCAKLARSGPATPITQRVRFDEREAQFKGCSRQVIWRDQSIRNGTGPSTWYTAPDGSGARTSAFAGSLRQQIGLGISSSAIVLAAVADDASAADCSGSSGIRVRSPAQ